jgi:hypothetical protein
MHEDVAALAQEQSVQALFNGLQVRLWHERRDDVADTLALHWKESGDAGLFAGHLAGALIVRLRADGAEELVEALSSLLSKGGTAPVFAFPERRCSSAFHSWTASAGTGTGCSPKPSQR